MTREELLTEIEQTAQLLRGLRVRAPSDRLLEYAELELLALRTSVAQRWPLEAPDAVSIGRFAARAFDDGSYPELVTRLVHVDALARRSRLEST